MIKLTPLQAFHVFYRYIVADNTVRDDSWELAIVLGHSDTDPEITCHTGGPTADPAVWNDWCTIAQEILKDDELKNICDQLHPIFSSREQAH